MTVVSKSVKVTTCDVTRGDVQFLPCENDGFGDFFFTSGLNVFYRRNGKNSSEIY